jgi:hypothetical protein
MIRDWRGREKTGELEPAMAVRRAHHGNLHALIAQSSHSSGPFSFDRRVSFEIEADLAKEIDRRREVIDDDSDVVHPFECHVSSLEPRNSRGGAENRGSGAIRSSRRFVTSLWMRLSS